MSAYINARCAQVLRHSRERAQAILDKSSEPSATNAMDAAAFLIHGMSEVFTMRKNNKFPPVDRPLKNQILKTTKAMAALSKYLLPAYAQKREGTVT